MNKKMSPEIDEVKLSVASIYSSLLKDREEKKDEQKRKRES